MEESRKEYLAKKLRDALASSKSVAEEDNPQRHIMQRNFVIAIIALFLLVAAYFSFKQVAVGNHNFNNITVNNNHSGSVSLRPWSELSKAEKEAIKQEGREKFADIINNTGKRPSWQPVVEWLNEEKGVMHPYPRDIFRERGN